MTVDITKLEAMHLASLACMIEHFYRAKVQNLFLTSFLGKLNLPRYWGNENRNYVGATDENILNLWRITDTENETHSQRIHDYLKKQFPHKDLSLVKTSLDEAFRNIFDHADADGNAFSFIKYDDTRQKLFVAVCDLGVGIATTVRNHVPSITSDREAIVTAMGDRFTIRSTSHNAGLGLGNIRFACTEKDAVRIICNNGFLFANRDIDGMLALETNYNFPGTLLYYELSLNDFEEYENLEEYEIVLNFDI